MGLRLITPPTQEPLTLAQVKKDLRVDHNDDDETLNRVITEAREWIERRLGQKMLTQTWDFIIDQFPANEIRLPFGPVQSILQVGYINPSDGLENILPSSDYFVDDVSYQVQPEPWLFPMQGIGWPVTMNTVNAVRVQFVCGYTDANKIPGPFKSSLRLKVRELYDGDDTTEQVEKLLFNFETLFA